MTDVANRKIKLLRVTTQAENVEWHLKNFIDRSENDYYLIIVGNGVTRYKANYPHVTFIDNEILRKVSPLKDLLALIKLIYICVKFRPQIIHSIMPKAGLLASIAGFITFVPVRIHTFTGQIWATMSGYSKFFYRFIDKIILKLCTKCLTDSPSQSMFLANNGLLDHGKPISYLGKGSLSGVALNRFDINLRKDNNALRTQLGIGENDFVYVFLARKSLTKGIKGLFESFAKVAHLPDVKLLFIGPDESNGYLSELYVSYKHLLNKIISLDTVTETEKYLAISDVLCLPSSSEGFGSIIIEAAALGVPAVGFNIVGLIDAIDHNNTGILVPFKDVEKFSEAMLILYNNRLTLANMRIKAKTRVFEYFSADTVFGLQKEFYKSLL